MNDSALKEFCIWARDELRSQVAQRLQLYGITAQGYGDASTDVIGARVLTEDEIRQRKELIDKFLSGPEEGYGQRYETLVERAAYTWFNRLAAIRYMEANGLLPSGVRMLSASDSSFAPQVLRMAGDVDIDGVDRMQVARLVTDGDDEKLFRYLLLAQCAQLADAMPDVFEPIGSAMELLLPDGLLRSGSVVERLVTAIPESDWKEGVEIVGWMYQYYNAQRKDDVFASFKKGKKAEADAIAPATQLFTPHWIVRYLVENSLGRLWMRSHPDSSLVDSMPYYIPDEETVDAAPSLSPESITVVDPACGSGHILTYCFDLLMKVYVEEGYTARDAVQSVLENNLSGIEIDPRAAELASFALAMKACEHDPRYLSRGNRAIPRVTCLVPVQVEQQELDTSTPYLADRAKLLDAMKHINECGSLFVPSPEDLAALDRASEELNRRLESGDLLAYALNTAVGQMKANCEPLARTYDVVVANPPYMGSSNMGRWLADWTKRNYPDSKRDLCTCFIERGFTLANPQGYSATVTSSTWMFISSFETLRKKLLESGTIISMLHTQGPNNHPDVFDANAAMIIEHAIRPGYAGSYFKLNKLGLPVKEKMLKEAIANPDCGWFYRRDASSFSAIPGSPIAYWLSTSFASAYQKGASIEALSKFTGSQNKTADNDRFLRRWWEVSDTRFAPKKKWIFYSKGGEFRRWYGNLERVVDWSSEARAFYLNNPTSNLLKEEYWYQEGIMYTMLTSGKPNFRYMPPVGVFDMGGPEICALGDARNSVLAFLNSSIAEMYLDAMNPTLNLQAKDIKALPLICKEDYRGRVDELVDDCVDLSKFDWDSFETSWDFRRHPMVGD